jgi:hypothetical protein
MQYELQQQETLTQNAQQRMPALRGGMASTVGAERMRDQVAGVRQKQEPEEVPFVARPKSRAQASFLPKDAEQYDQFLLAKDGKIPPGTGITK